MDESKTQC